MECSILEPQQRQSYTVTTRGSVATLCHSTGRNLNSQQAVTTAPENTSKQLLRSLWNATRGAQASIERAWPVDGGVRAVWVAACEHDNPSGRPLDRRCRSNNSHWYEWIPLVNIDLSGLREEFRDESLTSIMQAHKDEPRQVRQYRQLCDQRGQEPQLLDLSVQSENKTADVPPPLEKQASMSNEIGCSE